MEPKPSLASHDGQKTRPNKSLLITIDTEGDNIWGTPKNIETRNAEYLPRFQQLCESFGFKPTYLVNYEMAESPAFLSFGREALARKTAEIGMHLHAWNSPPIEPISDNDYARKAFLIEYPEPVMRRKIQHITRLLEDRFQCRITSHRAGRWAFNEAYARILLENGYLVDSSVTPGISWAPFSGVSRGGSDYRHFPRLPYNMNLADISSPGHSGLIEVPATTCPRGAGPARLFRKLSSITPLTRRVARFFWPEVIWFRPTQRVGYSGMRYCVDYQARHNEDCLNFMLHSSEFMPGGSPTFATPEDVEKLYRLLHRLFSEVAQTHDGLTLSEYASAWRGRNL